VRYLAQGNISLVREALNERSLLLNNAPYLAQPLQFVMPTYRWWEVGFYGAGLKMYDLLAGRAGLGVSEAVADKKVMDHAVGDLTKIAGQKPVVTMSKKAIAGFKIRENQAIGCMVTLRGAQMYEFLDRFVTVALPRVRDFRGISGRSFDGRGNYNIGVKEQIIFPEIEYDKVDALRGLNISITTTAKSDDECKALRHRHR